MKIVIPKELRPYEKRVAATPETVKKLISMGNEVHIEKNAGLLSGILDESFEKAGAKIHADPKKLYEKADLILKIQKPFMKGEGDIDEIALYPKGSTLVGFLSDLTSESHRTAYEKQGINAIALERIPRITRAQSMDILSSQSNLAGYKSVLEGAANSGKALPMMMTAAGTIMPAKVLVLGAGVAGLQAIATAKRLGAVVWAFDVRQAAKEQVESLGGKFIEVPQEEDAETQGGYAKEMSDDYKKRQAALIADHVKNTDIVITTALIPGKPAPVLISEDMVKTMKQGAVIVDLAVEMGGNCPLSEYGKVVEKEGVTLVGHANLPAMMAKDATPLFAKNVLNLIELLFDPETKTLNFNYDDEIIAAATIVDAKRPAQAAS